MHAYIPRFRLNGLVTPDKQNSCSRILSSRTGMPSNPLAVRGFRRQLNQSRGRERTAGAPGPHKERACWVGKAPFGECRYVSNKSYGIYIYIYIYGKPELPYTVHVVTLGFGIKPREQGVPSRIYLMFNFLASVHFHGANYHTTQLCPLFRKSRKICS